MRIVLPPTGPPYDGIVDASGGQFTTLQAADDELDAAAYSCYVKSGTYAAGLTVATNNALWVIEPGTTIEAAITLSGAGVVLYVGAQSDIQGLVTLSGDSCSLICQNGVNLDGILVSGDTCLVDGGGHGTVSDGGTGTEGIKVTGGDGIVQNITADTDTGGTKNALAAASDAKERATIKNCKVIDSGGDGAIYLDIADAVVEGCIILGADTDGVHTRKPRARIIGNRITAIGSDGIGTAGGSDDSVFIGNVINGATAETIDINSSAENCVAVGNRLDGAVNDSSGTSTVASNDATAF